MNERIRHEIPFFPFLAIVLFFAIGAVVMILWNNLLPPIIGVKIINYWQALGIFALCRILFGNFGFGKHRKSPFANKDFREKFMQMSPEEKQKFKEEWGQRHK
jgi:Ca2+/H+ antiporter, TMEM165/GDT1 family